MQKQQSPAGAGLTPSRQAELAQQRALRRLGNQTIIAAWSSWVEMYESKLYFHEGKLYRSATKPSDESGKVNTNCFEFTRNEVDMSLTRDRLGIVTLCN